LVLKEPRYCSPNCPFFRCARRALRRNKGRAWCTYTNDFCVGYKCNYAVCIRNRLLNNGLCGLSIKRRREELMPPERPELQVKVRSKILKKLGEKEIF